MGDFDGHPFRGNQWTGGEGGPSEDNRFQGGFRDRNTDGPLPSSPKAQADLFAFYRGVNGYARGDEFTAGDIQTALDIPSKDGAQSIVQSWFKAGVAEKTKVTSSFRGTTTRSGSPISMKRKDQNYRLTSNPEWSPAKDVTK
jgi:hypothetical protein